MLASVAFSADLTRQAFVLWKECQTSGTVAMGELAGFPTHARDGSVMGLLVVAGQADATRHAHMVNLARMIEHMDASLLAGLVERLKQGDPAARGDLIQVLRGHKYNVRTAARSLGMSRPTLYKYVRELEIPLDRVPAAARGQSGLV